MCRSLLVLLCLAAPCAAERFVLDSDEFNQRRQTNLDGQQVGPFSLFGGVAMYYEGRGFGSDDDSFIRVSTANENGPLTIRSDVPARLVGGWFQSSSSVGFIADLDRTRYKSSKPQFVDVTESAWQWVDLDIPFLNSITIAGCDPLANSTDNECFYDDEIWSTANADSLVFSLLRQDSVDPPLGGNEIPVEVEPTDPSNPIPEPSSIALLAVGAAIVKCSRTWRKSNRPR